MLSLWLYHFFSLYLSLILSLFSATRSIAQDLLNVKRVYIFVPLVDILLSLYFRFCGLSPLTVDLDEQTVMHFWIANHRRCNKPDLVLVHGYGGNSRWQFLNQVGSLSKSFNLYIPDLLFFGRSKTTRLDRSDALQAECVSEGLKRLGVERCAVFGVSYGGYVAYRMAEMHQQMVENVVIVSSGVCCTEDQKGSQLKKIKMEVVDLLVPKKPQDLRSLAKMSFYKYDPFKWIPDYFLQEFIDVMDAEHKEERLKMIQHLLAKKPDPELPLLTQETLLIWGDQDTIFPLSFAHHLKRHLGPKARLEIIESTGHAANIESSGPVNNLVKLFVMGGGLRN